jgi:hypothetical protein
VSLLLPWTFVLIRVVITIITVAATLKDHVSLLILLGLLLVVELCTLVGSQGTDSGKSCSGQRIALNLSALLLSFAAIVQFLTTRQKSGTGDGCNDLLILRHALGFVLALALFIFVVRAGVTSMGTAVIVAIARIVASAILIFFLVVVWAGGSGPANITGTRRGKFSSDLFYR